MRSNITPMLGAGFGPAPLCREGILSPTHPFVSPRTNSITGAPSEQRRNQEEWEGISVLPRTLPRSIPLLSSSSPKNNGPVIKQENEEQFFQGKTENDPKQSPQTRIQPTRGVAGNGN